MSGPSMFVAILLGVPGAGKSALVELLADATGAHVVCRDVIRDAMFRPCDYTGEEKAAAFEAVCGALAVNARLGRSSVVDGMCFSSDGQAERVRDLAARHGAAFHAFWCAVPLAVAKARVEDDRRTGRHLAADRDAALVEQVAASFREQPPFAVELDTTRAPGDNLGVMLDVVR